MAEQTKSSICYYAFQRACWPLLSVIPDGKTAMFIDDVCAHFEDWDHEDVVVELNNLQQKDDTGDYQDKFEELKL